MPQYIEEDVPLATHTTLGVGGAAEYYARVTTLTQLEEAVAWAHAQALTITVIGGGSNILVRDTGITGLVLTLDFTAIEISQKSEQGVFVTVGAGVELDVCIQKMVEEGLWGLENLSSIPGTVGAVPIQNVGAYGVEAKEYIHTVQVFNIETQKSETFTNDECAFAYRDSIFKKQIGKKFIIVSVTFVVTKNAYPRIEYADLKKYFNGEKNPSLREIRNAVIRIRQDKFPDWTRVGTAGSFFKNPIISETAFLQLQEKYPELPGYKSDVGVKISLGWILDHVCNLRGYTDTYGVGLYEHQALVLVCPHHTPTKHIEHFYKNIIAEVFEKTSIQIEPEVTIL